MLTACISLQRQRAAVSHWLAGDGVGAGAYCGNKDKLMGAYGGDRDSLPSRNEGREDQENKSGGDTRELHCCSDRSVSLETFRLRNGFLVGLLYPSRTVSTSLQVEELNKFG